MITYFLYDVLPLWLARLAALAMNSSLYRLMAAVWRRCRDLVRCSLSARLWDGSERLRRWTETSLLCSWMDAVIRWLTDFVGKCFGWIAPPLYHSAIGGALRQLPRFNFAWFYGLVFLGCHACPGPMWRNQFGLILSFLLFGALLLEAWVTDRVPFRARDR